MTDWDKYCDITKSLLDRFVIGNSITVLGEQYDNKPVGKGLAKKILSDTVFRHLKPQNKSDSAFQMTDDRCQKKASSFLKVRF